VAGSGLAEAITDFGNIVVALPVLAVMALWLWRHQLSAVAADILLRMVSKRVGGAFFGAPWHLTTGAPSGHACVSAVVYGSIGMLFALRGRGVARWAGVLLAFGVVVGVAVTRVTLGFHSPADVVTGLMLGGGFAVLTGVSARASPADWPPMLTLLMGLAGVAALMQITGLRFDSTAVL
jgi:membrane-associated phospholipid phosphatase